MRWHSTDQDDGAVAVIVALCLLLLFGAGAIAIDLGSAWETKRDLVVDTDAAALAGARSLMDGDCEDALETAEDFLEINAGLSPGTVSLVDGTDFFCSELAGTVRVDLTDEAQMTLAGAIGTDQINVYSSTTAALTEVAGGPGLRPLAACLFDDDIQDWLAGSNPGNRYKFMLNGSPATDCGGAPGNWGFACFDPSEPINDDDGPSGCGNAAGNDVSGNKILAKMLRYGYSGTVDLGDSPADLSPPADLSDPGTTDGTCRGDDTTDPDCDATPGSRGNAGPLVSAYDWLITNNVEFAILGITNWDGSGTGANTQAVAFIGVRLVDYHLSGPPAGRYLEFELAYIFDNDTAATLDEGTLTETSISIIEHDGSR